MIFLRNDDDDDVIVIIIAATVVDEAAQEAGLTRGGANRSLGSVELVQLPVVAVIVVVDRCAINVTGIPGG